MVVVTEYDVLVTDPDQRVALEVVRCLGEKNLDVAVVSSDEKKPLASYSRYVDETFFCKSYTNDKFKELINRVSAVFPISTNTHYELLDQYRSGKLLLPTPETFRKVNHKGDLLSTASKIELTAPETSRLEPGESIDHVPDQMDLPVICKLADDEGLYLEPQSRYVKAETASGLRKGLEKLSEYGKTILVQEYVQGTGVGFSGVYDRNSNFIAGIGHERLRELPPQGGPSTYCQSIDNNKLKESAIRLMDHLNWQGPFMVEFRKEHGSGDLYLMEVNPRYWGSLPLARAAGINIPYLHYCAITGEPMENEPKIPESCTIVKFLFMDLVSVAMDLRSSPHKLLSLHSYIQELFCGSWEEGLFDSSDWKPIFEYCRSKIIDQK